MEIMLFFMSFFTLWRHVACNLVTEHISASVHVSAESSLLWILISIILAILILSFSCVFKFKRVESDALQEIREDNRVYLDLNLDEQELYFQSREFLAANPYFEGELTLSQSLSIREKGVRAWEFVRDPMLTSHDILIQQKYELNFFKKLECSVQTNLPIPKTNAIYYFESKILSLPNPDDTLISIGIGIKPYPWFRLPGRHQHSISYDSDGKKRHNQPFPIVKEAPFPKLIEGDVVGIGYKVRSGSVFFTRNGKKLSELRLGSLTTKFKPHTDGQIYPIIGANNLCSIHVNLGQLGFLFIEGNVKKWGFAPIQGNEPAPPAYNPFNVDILLERSDVEDSNGLTDRENDFPPDFLDIGVLNCDLNENRNFAGYTLTDDLITMHSLLPSLPPHYAQSARQDSRLDERRAHNDTDDVLIGGPEASLSLQVVGSELENTEAEMDN